ncbi:hypothetical protein B0H14DRAFT_3508251 [Mycena olivaceomarginata]|nr:hypothetical protein B0H14DRAFT_3508251 [Mycena olivaceomarginata]
MKRSSTQRSGGSRKRTRNIFSLQSFGHSLRDPASTPSTARTGNLTSDGRRTNVQIIELQPPEHPSGPPPPVDITSDDDDWQDLPGPNTAGSVHTSSATQNPARKRKWYATTDDSLRYWVQNFRDEYLRVLITREGTMGDVGLCSCGEAEATYRCNECHGMQMFCQACVVEAHKRRPLCRIEAWNGRFFERREQRQLGLRVQLGHADNQPCPRAHRGREKFVVIAPNGFHHVAVDFCQCRLNSSTHRWEQLLLYGWFPSTPDNLQSAITVSRSEALPRAKITDNTGSRAFKRRYQLVLRLVREWRSLRALKRGGMGNDPDHFAAETRDGELAVECITCTKAGVNLPEGWEKVSPGQRFLYAVFWAFDACFRLKRKKISSWAADPSIQDEWAYFTAWKEYGPFVSTLGEQTEMSTCTGLAALDHANTKYAQGYATTGCGMVTCGRHEVVAKKRGGGFTGGGKVSPSSCLCWNREAERAVFLRYGNMDYMVASAWQHVRDLLFFLLSYDIMCQWSKNLKECLLKLPPALRFHLAQYVVKFVIPKLHILGHLAWCQEFFSLLFTLGAAQADMEGIERIWSSSGLMGASTREMGPGSRQDTLDDFWHHWNWNRVVGMSLTLRTRLLKATKELERQRDGLEEFSEAQEEQVPVWRKMVDDFESGASLVNPYRLPKSGPTLREIELELAREEEKTERASATVRDATDGTMTEYLMLGLEIEGQQSTSACCRSLGQSVAHHKELTDFVTRRTRISRQIKKLRLLQRKYSPGALQHLATAPDVPEAPEAECTPLLLPSALSAAERLLPLSAPGLAVSEARLRDAQCDESLGLIRHGLCVKKRLQTYRSRNSRRQHQNTCLRTLVNGQQRKVDLAADTYQQARAAQRALDNVTGASQWQRLNKADVRMLEDEEEAKKRKQRAMKGKRKEAAQENENGETLVDRWLHLESLLLTLRNMSNLYGGPVAVGVYTFLNPISYRYTERNAQSCSTARDIALRSRDSGDWRAQMSQTTKLHHQWLIDLENSAVGDFTIDRMGGIFDLTRSKSHPDEHIPCHARWLLPYLLGKHRIPLYFFYGQGFPLNKPVPKPLVKIGFVPDVGEVDYLQRLPGEVAFSPWSVTRSVCKSHRDGAPLSAPPSSHAPLTYRHSEMPADSTPPAISFPAVERDSDQKHGEDIHAFMKRRRLHNEKRAQHETSEAKGRCLAQENHAVKGGPPGKKGARIFIWEEEEGGFFIRCACNRTDAAERWNEFTSNQRIYDSFSNQWDLCTALAPNEEAEPDEMYDDDDDYDDSYVQFHQPALPADIIPSIPDVPGRQTMEEEMGERATQVLERAYDLDRENPYGDVDNLPGWRMQDVSSTILHRFSFEEPVAPISSSREMERKACAWAVGDESYTVPDTSWNVDVEIISQQDKKLYSIRPRGSEAPGPSILLESAATVLQIIRLGWGHDFAHLIRELVELGVEFHPSWERPANHVPLTPPSLNTLGRRPAGYKPTFVDFGVYVQRRDAFLRSPHGRAALFYGDIVGRLARSAIPDFADIACLDPSEDILKTGARMLSGNHEAQMRSISFAGSTQLKRAHLFNFLLMYANFIPGQRSSKAEDGQQLNFISWWPTLTAFRSSGLNTGWWSANCERWFVKRLKEIETKSAKLNTYAEWKNKIRFSNAARKVSLKNDELSAQYLAARLH